MTQIISLPLAAMVTGSLLCAGQGGGQFVFHREGVLGTSLEFRVTANTHVIAGKAEARVLAEIERESKVLSGYDSSSEFSRWMKTRGASVPVSDDLFEVLSRFDRYRALTGGAMDASAEAVSQMWKSAAAEHRLPARAEVDAAIAAARGPNWSLDRTRRTATHLSGTPLILNSFTKSYVAGKAADAALFATYGVRPLVVRMGGTVPIAELFQRHMNLDTVFFSFSTADEDFHAPNEFFRIHRLHEGLEAWARYWTMLGEASA